MGWIPTTEATTRQVWGQFVGREQEREFLDVRLRAALERKGHVVVIAGEPGVGKTRLAEETAERARELGLTTAWGRATEEEGSPPYWPFQQVFRALVGSGQAAALLDPHAGAGAVDGAARFRLFEAATDALLAVADSAPVLLVLDDVQWADPASVQLLVHLTMAVSSSRLVVLVLYRDTETVGQEGLRVALAALARESSVSRLRLAGLTESEVAVQLADVAGFAVPETVAVAVCRRTRGNPFFVTELGRVLADSTDGQLPDGIRDAVRARLTRLSSGCHAVVSAAAVLGSEVDPVAVAASAQVELGTVLSALDEAAVAGIVSGDGTGRRFAHDLIREAARLDVATTDRLALHRRMAEHLSTRGDVDVRVAEVAFHLLESLPGGDAVAAVYWAERAAVQASSQLAWEQAALLYRRALATASGPGFTPEHRCRLLLALARVQVRAYDMAGARQSLLTAADLARGVGDAETLAQAVLTMEGATDFLWNETGRALCVEALAGIPSVDSGFRARLLAQLVIADSWAPSAETDVRSAEALAMAERIGDRQAIAETLRARQMARSGPDGAADRLVLADRMLTLGTGCDDDVVLWGRLWRHDALVQVGDIDGAEAELDHLDAAAQRLRSPLARWHAIRYRATMAMARGRFSEAESLGQQAESLARRAGHEGALFPSLGFLAVLRAQTGGIDALPGRHLSVVASSPLRSILAWWKLAAGERAEAQRMYRTLPAPDDMPPFMLMPALASTAELAAEFDDKDTAAEAYRRLLPYADLFVCGGAGIVVIGGSARLGLGVAAATIGRHDEAVRHLRAAVEINERAGLPPVTASATYHLAKVLARRARPGDREEAAALAITAAAAAGQLGMAPLRRICEALATSLSGKGGSPLTPREEQIAVFVSQGLTNRQIAAAARISDRTAESHVQHILTKLGFVTRAQIATWVASQQIGTSRP